MTPGAPTSPGETNGALDRRPTEATNHGEQVRHTRNFCEKIRNEPGDFKTFVEEFRQGTKTKDQLKEKFKEKLKTCPAEKRQSMGLVSADPVNVTDTEIDAFLRKTGCFENQLLSQINGDQKAKDKAHENMVDNCIEVAKDEYGHFDETELKQALTKEDNKRLKTFLEVAKYRKTYIKKLPGSHDLKDKDFNDINFEEITKKVSEMGKTDPKRREIQEAWLKIAQVAHPEENLAKAFNKISHEGKAKTDLAGAYGTFFGDENKLISATNREKILNFLMRQYMPVVPFGVIEAIDPRTSKRLLTSDSERAEFSANLPADPEVATALKKDREEEWEKQYKAGLGTIIGTRHLPQETKVRLLSQFGSVAKAEKMLNYYRGYPGSSRSSTDREGDFSKNFKAAHDGLDPDKLNTKTRLIEELTARLGHRVENLELFEPGCVMQWKTKDQNNIEITGYYIIDTIPSEDPDEDNILTVRFLGNNKGPLSPSGLARHYTGADFYEYLDGCAEDGKISFHERAGFDTEMETNTTEKKLPRYFTDVETQAELRERFPGTVEVMTKESLNYQIDQLLNPRNENPRESNNPEDRKIRVGMIFTLISNVGRGINTFQVKDIDKDTGMITIWDGWGSQKKSAKNKSIKEMSFTEFIETLKYQKTQTVENGLYRLPASKDPFVFDDKEFNRLCGLDSQYEEGKDGGIFKKMCQATIREVDGKKVFGRIDPKTGIFTAMPVIKIGEKKDFYIESIDGTTVTFRRGTFEQAEFDEDKGIWKKKSKFVGSGPMTMSLAMLWSYLHANSPSFEFEKPIEKAKVRPKEKEGMSWLNVFKHAHSLGVFLHGDLWTAPYKAWEEQHNKDHAFAGKLTAALAMEKLQSGGYGPISGILNWAEWPSLMVAESNSSFHSYLDELVNKIDGMGSHHRARLIKKWGTKEHFPSPKFMAAMFATMQIFGQLYPYDEGKKDPRKQQWFWYDKINHSLGHKYPHMPPHGNKPWPDEWKDPGGNMMTEIQVCHKMFNDFKHPMLKNLGRRFQKYSANGQEKLKAGGPNNLNEKTTMEGKLDWMMHTALFAKLPETFGDSTELWLKEGYPTAISTMPYAAVLFGCREQQMLPHTQEAIKKEFQEQGVQIPMFVFMQNKGLGDVFRETSVAFAYTMGDDCGKELESLVSEANSNRINGHNYKDWRRRFEKFWRTYGKDLMHKLSGMRDPMLNLMINDSTTFDDMLKDQPEDKKKSYKRLRESKGVIRAYYNRIRETFDSPTHTRIPQEKGFYSGDHFRYRSSFEIGYPLGWMNWDNYLDGNLDKQYAAGSGAMSGDGIFNEIRGFMYDIPDLSKKMADQMGFTEGHPKRKHYIHKISKGLFEKNRDQMSRVMTDLIKAENPEAQYCSMTAMMLGIIPIKKLIGGTDPKTIDRYDDYYTKMLEVDKKAKEIGLSDYPASIKYRVDMAKKWTEIVKRQIVTKEISIKDIETTNSAKDLDGDAVDKVKENVQAQSGSILAKKLDDFDDLARKGKETTGTQQDASPTAGNQRNKMTQAGLLSNI